MLNIEEAVGELMKDPKTVWETEDHTAVLYYDEESKQIMLSPVDITSEWKLKEEE